MLNKSPIIITGAAGFVGANLCRYFLSRGTPVIAVDHQSSGNWRLSWLPRLKHYHIDLTSKNQVTKFVRTLRPEFLVNCAAYGAYSNQTDEEKIYQVNFKGVKNLLDNFKGLNHLKAFIQAGTSSEYGKNCFSPTEDSTTMPDSHYAVSKVAATSLVQYYGKSLGVPAWVMRIYSAYGPLEDASRLIPTLLLSAKKGKLPVLVSPSISRDFLYIDDIAVAIERLIVRCHSLPKGEIYNIGTGKKTTLKDLVGITRKLFKIKEMPHWNSMKNRSWDNKNWYSNPKKAERSLGWTAQTDLAHGLLATSRWMDSHPELVRSAIKHTVFNVR